MNILFLSIGNLNSIKDGGIYADLLREFERKGHHVYVVSQGSDVLIYQLSM